MLKSKSSSVENNEELCKDLCKSEIEKLEALRREIQNFARLSKDKTSVNDGYCHKNCYHILADPGPSTGVKNPIHEIDLSEETAEPFTEASSSSDHKPSEQIEITSTEGMKKIDLPDRNGKHVTENTSALKQPRQPGKTNSTVQSSKSVSIFEEGDKKNIKDLITNCHEGKICPTIGGVLNRKLLEKISAESVDSEIYKQISEVLISHSQHLLRRDKIEDTNLSESKAYNCQDEKPCPTIDSILKSRVIPKLSKQDIEGDINEKSSTTIKTPPTETSELSNEIQSISSAGHEQEPLKYSCRNGTPCPAFNFIANEISKRAEKEVHYVEGNPSSINDTFSSKYTSQISAKESTQTDPRAVITDPSRINYLINEDASEISGKDPNQGSSKSVGTPLEHISEADLADKISTEIKSTDLGENTDKQSKTIQSQKEHGKINEFDRWKQNCLEGKFSLQSLLEMCENDPDFLLASLKIRHLGPNVKLPDGSIEVVDEPEQFYKYESVFGEKFGDPKYHLLLVDASTRISKSDMEPKEPEPRKVEIIETVEEPIIEEELIIKEKEYEIYAEPLQEESYEDVPVLIASPPPEKLEEEEHRSIISTREKKTSILIRDDRTSDIDDEDKRTQNAKRPSAVSWRAMGTTSESDSAASLEQVVKDATAKAESFRQNLDTRRQHSLLDIVKRKSTIDKKIEDQAVPNNSTTKKKKFFNFKCCQKKKPLPPPKEKDENTTDTEEESSEEELDDRKPKQSSSLHVDIYRRRNTSLIENPVFEKNKELNQFLNNI